MKKSKRIVMNPEVRIIPIWRSEDGELIGYMPAIFGSDAFERPIEWRTFLVSALDHIEPFTEDGSGVYKTQKEALDTWENARTIPLTPAIRGRYAIPDDTGDLIDANGFYRTVRPYVEAVDGSTPED